MQYDLFDSFDTKWSKQFEFDYKENITEEQKEILKKGLNESEMPTDIGDRMEEEIVSILR